MKTGKVIAIIPARGGSKGLPRKNLRLLGNKTLVGHAIDVSLSSKWIDRVILSSDDKEIMSVAESHGAEVPFTRPVELATDNSPEWHTWQHLLKTLYRQEPYTLFDALVCVPPTSPLRNVEDVDACIELLMETDADIVITVRESNRNPYFNMIKIDSNGYAELASPSKQTIHRRQDAPQIYDITTVAYAARPQFVLNASSIFEGKVKTVKVPHHRALDIDTELDLQFAEFLLKSAI